MSKKPRDKIAIIKKGESERYERWVRSGKGGYKDKLPESIANVRNILKKYEGKPLPVVDIRFGDLVHVQLPSGEFSIHKKVFKIYREIDL